jgi:hypothetical protein
VCYHALSMPRQAGAGAAPSSATLASRGLPARPAAPAFGTCPTPPPPMQRPPKLPRTLTLYVQYGTEPSQLRRALPSVEHFVSCHPDITLHRVGTR